MKPIECDDIVGHAPEFLAPMMRSGNIASINVVCTSKPRHVTEDTRVLGRGIEIPFIYQIYGCKKKNQNIRTPSETLLLNSGLYILFINMEISFFFQKGLKSRAAYIRGGL